MIQKFPEIRAERIKRGLTLKELEAKSGVDYWVIQMFETGMDDTGIDMRILKKIAKGMGLRITGLKFEKAS
ncbi:MAG: helix-turn-helix transcriptional regulator [Patescibacteria group bacterium]|nr:helix-turn-helix transcriptional regulator [Patescibacteria group bacterium]